MSSTNRSIDPAQGAADLLRRFGMALLGVALPCAAFYSRRAAILLLPIGATLVFMGTVIDPAEPIGARLRGFAIRPGFAIAAALLIWMGATILWSPFPMASAERLYNSGGVLLVTLAAMAAIPARMRAPSLYFLPIGAFAAVLAACLVALASRGAISFGGANDPVLAIRGAAAMAVMAPVSLGWLMSRGRAPEAAALAIGVACAAFVLGDMASLAIVFITLGAFFFVRAAPRSGAVMVGAVSATAILSAPLLPFLLQPIASLAGYSAAAAFLGDLAAAVQTENLRLITGHGLEMTPRAMAAGLLPASDPPSLALAIWFDLGVMGALFIAGVIFDRMRRALEQPPDVAAAEIALIACVVAQTMLGVATLQAWWLSTLAAAAIATRAIARGQFRTRRPRARLFGAKTADE